MTSQDRFSVGQSHFAPQKIEFALSWNRFPLVMKPHRERFVTELATALVTVLGWLSLGGGPRWVSWAWASGPPGWALLGTSTSTKLPETSGRSSRFSRRLTW